MMHTVRAFNTNILMSQAVQEMDLAKGAFQNRHVLERFGDFLQYNLVFGHGVVSGTTVFEGQPLLAIHSHYLTGLVERHTK